jgi:hypothetical protein|tara:strand:- start:396 stop:635 length:240 start_codon:yes stop_codon:yes gene_type:complete
MGLNKRYIDDEIVIETFRSSGCQAVIDMYTKGVDVLIASGELSNKIDELIKHSNLDDIKDYNKISTTIARSSYKKRMEI